MGVWYPQAAMAMRITWENNEPARNTTTLRIRPQDLSVNLNGYDEADTFSATVDYKTFPFDPRAIRSCYVAIHMQDMENVTDVISPTEDNNVFIGFVDEQSITMDQTTRSVSMEGRDLSSLFLDKNYPRSAVNISKNVKGIVEDLCRLAGAGTAPIADEGRVILQRGVVRTQPVRNSEVRGPVRTPIGGAAPTLPVNPELKALLEDVSDAKAFASVMGDFMRDWLIRLATLKVSPVGDKIIDFLDEQQDQMDVEEIIDEMKKKSAKQRIEESTLKKKGDVAKRPKVVPGANLEVDPSYNFWDTISLVAAKDGLVAYMDRDRLILREPRNFYAPSTSKFHFLYGSNLGSLDFTRQLGRRRRFNARFISWIPSKDGGKVHQVRIPADATDPEFLKTYGEPDPKDPTKRIGAEAKVDEFDRNGNKTGEKSNAPYETYPVASIASREQLIKLGEARYVQIAKQQIEGSFSTTDMAFYKDDKSRATFRDIKIGEFVKIGIRMDDLNQIRDIDNVKTRKAWLESRGYPTEVAEQFAKSLSQFRYNFVISEVNLTFGSEGFQMNVGIVNIIEEGV